MTVLDNGEAKSCSLLGVSTRRYVQCFRSNKRKTSIESVVEWGRFSTRSFNFSSRLMLRLEDEEENDMVNAGGDKLRLTDTHVCTRKECRSCGAY